MSQHNALVSRFDARSLLVIASFTLGVLGSAHAQSTAAPATADEVSAAFTKADKNGDSKLSREEAAALPAIAANFDRVDSDKDGAISTAEFGKAMKM